MEDDSRAGLRAFIRQHALMLISFTLACFSAITAAGLVGWLFRSRTDEWWQIAGMLVGVYVGGTANMSAVGIALYTDYVLLVEMASLLLDDLADEGP